MSERITRKDCERLATNLGLHLECSSPGEGYTRFEASQVTDTGSLGATEFYAKGAAECWDLLYAYKLGIDRVLNAFGWEERRAMCKKLGIWQNV